MLHAGQDAGRRVTDLVLRRQRDQWLFMQGSVAGVAGLTALRTLDLNGNALTASLTSLGLGGLLGLQRLDLGGNVMTGPLPADLAECAGLTYLDLSGTALDGPLPAGILGSLVGLTHLDLSFNAISGPLPSGELRKLTKLSYLNLQSDPWAAPFSGPFPDLTGLTALLYLELSGNAFARPIPAGSLGSLASLQYLGLAGMATLAGEPFPPDVASLSRLTAIMATGCGFAGHLPRLVLPALANLDLGANALVGPLNLSGLPALRKLALGGNPLGGSMPDLSAQAASLVTLGLSGCSLAGPVPSTTLRLSALQSMDLSNNGLTGTLSMQLAVLPAITVINIANNRLSGPLASLTMLPTLQQFGAAGNTFSGNLPKLPASIVSLDLSGNHFTGNMGALGPFNSLPALSGLKLASNALNGRMPNLSGAAALVFVDVTNNQLNGALPTNKEVPPGLATLLMAGNKLAGGFQDKQPYPLSVEYLDFSSNQINGRVPAWMGALPLLSNLTLSFNQLSGAIPNFTGAGQLSALLLDHNKLTGGVPPSKDGSSSIERRTANAVYSFITLQSRKPELMGELALTLPMCCLLCSLGGLPLLVLDLSFNQLAGPLPAAFAAGVSASFVLYSLDLSDNQLTGPLPAFPAGRAGFGLPFDLRNNFFYGSAAAAAGDVFELFISNCAATGMQRTATDCAAFCGLGSAGGSCGGHGVCTRTTDGAQKNSCACDAEFKAGKLANGAPTCVSYLAKEAAFRKLPSHRALTHYEYIRNIPLALDAFTTMRQSAA
eukprot:SM000065S20207  [mRNA]  locus=s65:335987:339863:+ [translate_table: standard]